MVLEEELYVQSYKYGLERDALTVLGRGVED